VQVVLLGFEISIQYLSVVLRRLVELLLLVDFLQLGKQVLSEVRRLFGQQGGSVWQDATRRCWWSLLALPSVLAVVPREMRLRGHGDRRAVGQRHLRTKHVMLGSLVETLNNAAGDSEGVGADSFRALPFLGWMSDVGVLGCLIVRLHFSSQLVLRSLDCQSVGKLHRKALKIGVRRLSVVDWLEINFRICLLFDAWLADVGLVLY